MTMFLTGGLLRGLAGDDVPGRRVAKRVGGCRCSWQEGC